MKEIKNINQVEKILSENNIEIKDRWIFYNFWRRVYIKDNIKECWNWTLYALYDGYGLFWDGKKKVRSHRMAYELTKGKIPDGLQVQHICNNRRCCNPYHLELGDNTKNIRYKVKCGRQSRLIGENSGNAKLMEDQVREIHIIYNEQRKFHPGFKQWQIIGPIAQKFNVSTSTIKQILHGKLWYHIYKENQKRIKEKDDK